MAKKILNIGAAANDGTGDPIRTSFSNAKDNFDELYAAKINKTNSTVTGTNSTDLAGSGNNISDSSAIAAGENNIISDWPARGFWHSIQVAFGYANRVFGRCGIGMGVGTIVDGIYGVALGNGAICSGNDSVAMGGQSVTGRRKYLPIAHGADSLHGLGGGNKGFVLIDPTEGDVTPIFPNTNVYDPNNPGVLVWALHPYCILIYAENPATFYLIIKSEYTAGVGTKVWYDNATDLGANYYIFSSYAPQIPVGFVPGNSMTAEGKNTNAAGGGAHSEGISTKAWAGGAHAEGLETKATGGAAHAEGRYNIASNSSAHAEGESTIASGENSHTEGTITYAEGENSHSEGNLTHASGKNSHVEGELSQATALQAHAEGTSTLASGEDSHAEGKSTIASGIRSHAEGYASVASGASSHAMGQDAKATLPAQFAQGATDGKFSVVGDAQQTMIVLKRSCVGTGWHDFIQLVVEYGKSYAAETLLIGRQFSTTNGVPGQSAAYKFLWTVDRGAKMDFAPTDVDTAANTIVVTEVIKSGTKLMFTTTGALPATINAFQPYYAIYVDATHIQVETSVGGGVLDITGQGTGVHSYSRFNFTGTTTLIGRSFVDDGDTVGNGTTTGIMANLHTTNFQGGAVRLKIDQIATRSIRWVATTHYSEVI